MLKVTSSIFNGKIIEYERNFQKRSEMYSRLKRVCEREFLKFSARANSMIFAVSSTALPFCSFYVLVFPLS